MDTKLFESALISLLRPYDATQLHNTLPVIRTHLVGPSATIKENINKILEDTRYVHELTRCLQQRQPYIINLTLSIFSRCCIDRNFARISINRYNLLSHLNSVLKRYDVNSVRIRIFRIVGSMCQHWDRLANTIVEREPNLHFILKIITFLKSTASIDVSDAASTSEMEIAIVLAIRTLKELANKETTARLVDLGALKAVGVALVKFTPMWINEKKHEELLMVSLKLIYSYSKYRSPKFITELQDADGENALVYLGKLVVLCPFLVLKIINNFINVTKSRSDLPLADISRSLVEKLKNANNFPEGYEDKLFREYLKFLCFFIQYPAIRENIQNPEIICALLTTLKCLESLSDFTIRNCSLIISTLGIYTYDDNLLLIMLQNGITHILANKLEWLLGSNVDFDLKHEFKFGRTHKCSNKLNERAALRSFSLDNFFERTMSPCSEASFSSGSLSPLSSPSISEAEEAEVDSGDYSPVCSDVDCEFPLQDDGIDGSCSPSTEDIEQSSLAGSNSTADNNTITLKKELASEIVKLIKLFTTIRPVTLELINSPHLLVQLLMLCAPWNKHIRPVETAYYIRLISRTPEYLIGLMQTNFFANVYKMTILRHNASCITCQELYTIGKNILHQISFLVEHKCGKGDIAHQLYRGTVSVKRKIVPTIPLIVEDCRILNQLMKIGGGLDILLELLQENADPQMPSVVALGCLAKKLGIANPVICQNTGDFPTSVSINIHGYKVEESCMTVVNFKLDDGSVIEADRNFLCQKSAYFNQLLSGTFKESLQDEIHLPNVTVDGLKFLLMLIKVEIDNREALKFDVDLKILLDAIILADLYLLEDYCVCLTISVQLFKFTPTVMSSIYQWSLESHTNILRIESVAYMLVADTTEDSRCAMFKSVLGLEQHKAHFIDDIRELITRYFMI